MYLLPSTIHFTSCTGHLNIEDFTREGDIVEASRRMVRNPDYPKLQVVEKDGHYFTLNNTQLHVFRRLEDEGQCSRVKVDRIPLNEIPEGIRRMMVVPAFQKSVQTTAQQDNSRSTGRGYQRLKQKDCDVERKSDTEENHGNQSVSEESDFQESDSEYDWSDDNGTTDFDTSDEELPMNVIVDERVVLLDIAKKNRSEFE